ncbi:MAG TPA: LysM peptidoglycan-binding domain-containing protein [Actinomycetota bacterium]|nr:LysM peptidoglycan-binding domain-containing protein [Actinomycetota bacterium]
MALRSQDLIAADAVVYRFPVERVRVPRARVAARRHRALVRRRRLGLGIVALSIIGLTLIGGGTGGSAAAGDHRPGHVVVQPGQTLWSIATRYAPAGVDPRAYVDRLEALNHVDAGVAPGTRLRLP